MDQCLKDMDQLLMRQMDDLDHTSSCSAVIVPVVGGDALDMSCL